MAVQCSLEFSSLINRPGRLPLNSSDPASAFWITPADRRWRRWDSCKQIGFGNHF
jgi:hypothetical protein